MKLISLFVLTLCCSVLPELQAQQLIQRNAPDTDAGLRATSVQPLQQQVKPAFRIQPLVHRLVARRGQLLDFEFEIESSEKPTRLEVTPVGMKQQRNGVILPNPEAVTSDVMKLTSARIMDLSQGEKQSIKGQIRIPTGENPFLTYGVLVKEIPLETRTNEAGDKPAVGIKFITQYLLRVDIEVLGVRADSIKQLVVESAVLREQDGAALIELLVNNPSESAMEYQIRTQLVSDRTRKTQSSMLYVPVRSNQEGPERYDARILGETQLNMHGNLQEAVFPGAYTLKVEVLYKGRVYTRVEFPIEINTGDFPAQDATIVRVADDIVVEPSAVELSLRRGGARIQSLTIQNDSQQKIVAKLTVHDNIGGLGDGVVLRPDVVELNPGQKRKVLVMLGKKRDYDDHVYAFARVTVSPEVGEAIGAYDVPIALLTNSESTSELQPGDLKYFANTKSTGFEIPVQNIGKRHVSLYGRLQMQDQFGRGFLMEDGYGRWILPGQQDKLKFTLPRLPPPGTYTMRLEIQRGEGLENLQMQQTIQLESTLERVSDADTSGVPK